jgi:hypothetical protein
MLGLGMASEPLRPVPVIHMRLRRAALAVDDVKAFLTHLAVDKQVSASSQETGRLSSEPVGTVGHENPAARG